MDILRVGVIGGRPPLCDDGSGLDIDLMTAIAEKLGDSVEFVVAGSPGDVADGLASGALACAAGLAAAPERERAVAFAPPYLITGHALAVDTERHRDVGSVGDLRGLTLGVQAGGTAASLAGELVAQGRAGTVVTYGDGGVRAALSALSAGECDAVLELAPVLGALARQFDGVEVVETGLSTEHVGVAVAEHDQQLLSRIAVAQSELEADGTLQRLRRRWLGNPYSDQGLGVV
ncbi:amino acid ABC transporter substrate-binding protein, PAAT family [Mycolicibacterium chubuense NBB4]|uniref:Amino acid ABC transporter substrate-binding protein, PAAT family n=1 Tax=Mycolicibacterium chubuense (strain NBB4) TaxID=710421 RepID=I4BIU3_MYCCN|nr:ABC transporter substrate-binding protein [Mycolicibacterium chubuense]AFM17200.1 amino acid ABC transporter substrate-binding protein, PAAT family [Mycolicibacterium chubuense NBB4]